MRRMIPQKLIDELTARLEREEQTKEMIKNITVHADDDTNEYSINLASDGETYLTIAGYAVIVTDDVCDIVLHNIPAEFLYKISSSTYCTATNSLGGGESVEATQNITSEYIKLTISAGEPRAVYFTITLASEVKEL